MIDFKTSTIDTDDSYKSLTIALAIIEDYEKYMGGNDIEIGVTGHFLAIKSYYDFMGSLKQYLVNMDSEQKSHYFKAFKTLVDMGLHKMESDLRTVQ